jgi:divalent metal cation (Fe/Co/Zn/Cd) transporter
MTTREAAVQRGRWLEYFTLAYNSLEGVLSILAGVIAGSVSLVGFGLDSIIEVSSGGALLWRLHHDRDVDRRERRELLTLRIVGWCFFALAAYVAFESIGGLVGREAPDRSIVGIVIASISVVVMPVLARQKRRVADVLGSGAMRADSRQTDFCTYLSAILLAGLLLNATLGWWWADPVAALAMVPIIAREGWNGVRGKVCCDTCSAKPHAEIARV